ncbi:hypothetical protein Esti_000431 [Eimeria stiedai]
MQEFDRHSMKAHTQCLTEEQKFHGQFAKRPKKQHQQNQQQQKQQHGSPEGKQQKQQQQKQQQSNKVKDFSTAAAKRKIYATGDQQQQQEQQQAKRKRHKEGAAWCWRAAATALLEKQPQKRMHWKRLSLAVVKQYKETVGPSEASFKALRQQCLAAIPLSFTSDASPFISLPRWLLRGCSDSPAAAAAAARATAAAAARATAAAAGTPAATAAVQFKTREPPTRLEADPPWLAAPDFQTPAEVDCIEP